MEEVRLGAATLHVLPVVRGLPSEAPVVAETIAALRPAVVGLSIGPEELDSLRRYKGGPLEPENFEEVAYVAGLSAWEAPIKPPPCFSEAIRAADAQAIPVEALDMDEMTYTDTYVKYVSTLEVLLQGRLQRKLERKKYRARNPREFVLEWDSEVNASPGFRRLQAAREAFIAARLREVSRAGTVLAIIEVERAGNVIAGLRT